MREAQCNSNQKYNHVFIHTRKFHYLHSSTEPMNAITSTSHIADIPIGDQGSYLRNTMADLLRGEATHEMAAEKLICWQTEYGQTFGKNTDDHYLLEFMPQLRELYAALMAGDEPPVHATFIRWAKQPGFTLTKLGKKVLAACEDFAVQEAEGRGWEQAYAHHNFHPIVAVMLRAVIRWWSPICSSCDSKHFFSDNERDRKAMEGLHALVDFVRSVCRSQAFQNLLHDYERKAKDNFRSGRDYIIAQFERHARLLVLRIDLYFRPDAKGWGYSKAADKAVKKYLRALTMGRIVPGRPRFIIKRENGISRGMHFHLMVLLDGHLHRSAHHLTQVMGEAWIKRVGKDKGSFFNCYAKKDIYYFNGLGLVHVSDAEKILGIRIALWYMSKQDCELKVHDSKVKNFWRSWKVSDDNKRGAPRKNVDSMSLIKRLLAGERSKHPPGFVPMRNVQVGRMVMGLRVSSV
jgi:hypothetical protein